VHGPEENILLTKKKVLKFLEAAWEHVTQVEEEKVGMHFYPLFIVVYRHVLIRNLKNFSNLQKKFLHRGEIKVLNHEND
jgi:hypothetical protein